MIDNPRHNILSVRVSDGLKKCIKEVQGEQSMQDFLTRAICDALVAEHKARRMMQAANQ